MTNQYLDYISDEKLLECIGNLYLSYKRARAKISKNKFYNNKIDTFKLTFDAKFNKLSEEEIINNEIMRQVDKSINNAIGLFHEEVLGCIKGYERGALSGWDIKSTDDKLFADIKNKHNTMNSSSAESLFQKLERFADEHKRAKCYWVQILAKDSFCELWTPSFKERKYSHNRIYKISGDQFYNLLAYGNTKKGQALYDLYKVLPTAINDFLNNLHISEEIEFNSAYEDILSVADEQRRTIFDQITFDNYKKYIGYDKL